MNCSYVLLAVQGRWALAVLLVLLVSLSLPQPARAQLVALDSAIEGQYLGEYLSIWKDPSGNADLEVVKRQQEWQVTNERIPNFGHTSDVYWFRLEIQTAVEDNSWVLVLSNVLLDYVDIFLVSSDGELIDQYSGGAQRKITDRAILHRYFVVPISAQGESNLTLYFRVASFHAVQFPLALWPIQKFAAFDELETILTGVLLGSLFIMLLYNFFLYTTLRDPLYLAYVGSVFGFLMLQICVKGFGYRFFWPDQLMLSAVSVFVSAFATIFFAISFASWFMQLRIRKFPLLPLVEVARWSALACALFIWYLPDGLRLYLMTGIGVLAIALGFIAIFTYYSSNDRPMQIFTAGWVVLLVGSLLFLLNKLGWISVNAWTEQTMSVGTVIEVILFSMALGDRINSEKEQAIRAKSILLRSLDTEREEKQNILRSEEITREAKELTLSIQKEANERLEAEIEERTAELKQTTDRLEDLVKLDPLTGVFNRRHFNETINDVFKVARKDRTELSLLMIDVDHFKSINDQYGHLVGDHCLVSVADALARMSKEGGGLLFRFGGEEFAIVLENTSKETAQTLAEKIRGAIESTLLAGSQGPDHVTISIGGASIFPGKHLRPEALVALADAALYQAKELGRNRVVMQQDNEGQSFA